VTLTTATHDLREDGDMTSAHDHGDNAGDIEPDAKDWTWVLQRPCPDCGLDAGSVPGLLIAARLRMNAARWMAVCARADVRVRPYPRVWSPLEYACHVRDVCRVFESRVTAMGSEVDPLLEDWDQDAAAIAGAYGAADPGVVSAELAAAAQAAALSFDALEPGQWQRRGRRSSGLVFTMETLGQYFLHDLSHHLHDVRG
jgi:hypothetical protein